tara:strand:- start:692 stop:949 length:258 start_codon:yes stop_codon:yes gene_type:complete
MNLKMISCPKCDNDMPELRKINYGYNFCVSCSETYNLVSKKRAITIQKGEGDHTWNETVLMGGEEYKKHINPESEYEITFGVEDK